MHSDASKLFGGVENVGGRAAVVRRGLSPRVQTLQINDEVLEALDRHAIGALGARVFDRYRKNDVLAVGRQPDRPHSNDANW